MEKKIIIALQGVANVGKTHTLIKVYEMLKDKNIIEKTELEKTNRGRNGKKGDIKIIVVIKGVKIGIASQGDPGYGLKEILKELVEKECAIIVCAMRTRGETVEAVDAVAKESNYRVILKKKEENKLDSEAANDMAMAKEIIEEIEKALS